MTKKDSKKMEMYERCDAFFTAHQATFTGYVPLVNAISSFKATLLSLRGSILQQLAVIKGYTLATEARKKEMVAQLIPISRKALAWALLTNRQELALKFDISSSRLLEKRDEAAIAAAQDILNVVSANIMALTAHRVVAEDVDVAQERLDDFIALLDVSSTAVKNRKVATKEIAEKIALIDKRLRTADYLVTGEYSFTNAEMVNQYESMREIGDPGYRRTGLTVHITGATGAALEGVVMKLREGNKEAQTNAFGVASLISVKPGIYHVDFIKEGHARTEIVELKRGRVVEMDLALAS